MKTAAKVFLYIKCVIYAILIVMYIIFLGSDYSEYISEYILEYYPISFYVFILVFSYLFLILFPLIVGLIAEKKLKKAKSKKELLVIGIFTLLFYDLLTGIFMLCITDDELSEENTKSESDNKPTPTPKKIEDATAKIKDAENLFKSGIITEEEYQTIRTNANNQHF